MLQQEGVTAEHGEQPCILKHRMESVLALMPTVPLSLEAVLREQVVRHYVDLLKAPKSVGEAH